MPQDLLLGPAGPLQPAPQEVLLLGRAGRGRGLRGPGSCVGFRLVLGRHALAQVLTIAAGRWRPRCLGRFRRLGRPGVVTISSKGGSVIRGNAPAAQNVRSSSVSYQSPFS